MVLDDIGARGRVERVALGETINIAAHLQTLAEPDTVVMSAATHGLVAGYVVCHRVGRQTLKGLTTPTPVYRVVEASQTTSRLDLAVAQGLTPLVGRDGELGLLRQQAQQAKAGQGHVVMISGEPGIGKSRLALTLKGHMRQEGSVCLEFRCSPYHQATALYPIVEHLQRLVGFHREDDARTKLEKLQHLLAGYRFPQADTIPLLATFFSLPPLEGVPPLTLSPQRQKQRLTEALIAWLVEEADRTPVYLLWEDLQWADPSTLEVLTLYLDQVPMMRTLAVLTYRPEFTPPWGNRSYLSQMTLSRLERPHVETMVKNVSGDQVLPPEVLRQIVGKADGVPLFVEELTKTVVESGCVQRVWRVAEPPLSSGIGDSCDVARFAHGRAGSLGGSQRGRPTRRDYRAGI